MILLLAMTVGPAIFLIYSSRHNIQMFGGESRFVGLRNFQELLTDATFLHSLLVTLAFVAIAVAIELVIGVALAMALAPKTRANSRLTPAARH